MEHPRIDDEKILDRYLARRLSTEDEALFEEHLFECSDCLEKVSWGEELRRGLQAVAAEEAARATVAFGLMAWLRQRPTRLAGLAALLLAVAVLPALVVWQRLGVDSPSTSGVVAGLTEPVGNFMVVSLGVVRDAGGEGVEIRVDPEKAGVLLSLELQTVEASRYRVTLETAEGELLWRGDDLEPNLYDTLLLALPARFLTPGSYRITVEGLLAASTVSVEEAVPAGEMELRVLPEE